MKPALAVLLLLTASTGFAQDPELLKEIRAIRAIDNHSHLLASTDPAKLVFPAEGLGQPEFDYPVRLRPDNPEWARVWKALYGIDVAEMTRAAAAPVLARKAELVRAAGWRDAMLDAAGIDIALVNMPEEQKGPRYRWVPNANALMDPFKSTALPAGGLEMYEEEILREQLEDWKKAGAIAIKLSVAYQRTLSFRKVAEPDAMRIYAARVQGRTLGPADERNLQDYLFRALLREAGKVGLPVHIHTGIGADPWFDIEGANPLLLEDALNDKELRATKVVLIHGGWPYDRQAGVMLIKPNVWADFSAQTFLRSPRALSETLRAWLEWYPEKVLFGTDAYPDPGMPLAGWEETLWLASDSARQALAIALTGMMQDGEITRARALELARMVLRENARKLYGL